jgi:hypothetical protein
MIHSVTHAVDSYPVMQAYSVQCEGIPVGRNPKISVQKTVTYIFEESSHYSQRIVTRVCGHNQH